MDKEKETIKSENKKVGQFRELKGIIVSDKMDKTVIIRVDRSKRHKIYKKKYTVSKRYKSHDENNQYKVGDYVLIRQVRPISKDKKWKVIRKIK